MQIEELMQRLRSLASAGNVAGMARYGIATKSAYGIPMPTLRAIAKEAGRDHVLAQQLWSTGVHEARIMASLIDSPQQVTQEQMESWVKDFDSWDVCDQVSDNLFAKTEFAYGKAAEWSQREEEFVKRAAFALIAALAVHDKRASDEAFERFLPIIEQAAADERNFVRKAVNWSLRGIGKRNARLNATAVAIAKDLRDAPSKSARWVGSDALRELTSEKVQKRLAKASKS